VNVLVVGGNRFMGRELVARLLAGGHAVTVFNRGGLPEPFGERVERLRGDRATDDFDRLLSGRSFAAAVDFAAFQEADARRTVGVLSGRVGHYLFIGTGQVYLVRQGCPRPSRESDYAGPVMPAPPADHPDRGDWEYGVGKRACEDVLEEAFARLRFPATRLRLPMVYGERDPSRRLEGYLWRLLDGGPLLVPDGGPQPVRHVYAGEVVRLVLSTMGRAETFGQVYNICQQEAPSLLTYLRLLARLMDSAAALVSVPRPELEAAGLEPAAVSPFSGRWMSLLDPARARAELGFEHRPLRECLQSVVASFLAHPPSDRPAGQATRAREVELARRLGAEPAVSGEAHAT
jgi:nucleoside-diphosphate-sugar epimerase